LTICSSTHGARQIPDISAVAYDLAVYFQGQWGAVGGTSAAAPIWAAGMALANEGFIKRLGKFAYSPQLSYLAYDGNNGMNAYFDVTSGNNLYYPATPGWITLLVLARQIWRISIQRSPARSGKQAKLRKFAIRS